MIGFAREASEEARADLDRGARHDHDVHSARRSEIEPVFKRVRKPRGSPAERSPERGSLQARRYR